MHYKFMIDQTNMCLKNFYTEFKIYTPFIFLMNTI